MPEYDDSALPMHPSLLHPTTGLPLRAIGIVGGQPVWPVMGGDGTDDSPALEQDAPGDEPSDTDGPGTDTEDDATDWKAEADRHKVDVEKWKALARKHESRAKNAGNADEIKALKEKAAQYDALAAASKTEHERAIDEAREAAAKEATDKTRASFQERLVRAEFKAALAGRVSDDARDELLDGLNLAKFLDDDGEPDADRVREYVARLAPAAPTEKPDRKPADLGQGRRPPAPKERPASLGAAISAHYKP